jgi:hypothetical protein
MKRQAFLAVVACLWGCALPGTGWAGSITYTAQFGATGAFGTQIFNALVTFSSTGDTANVMQSADTFANVGLPTKVTVAGIGTANLTGTVTVGNNQGLSRAEFDVITGGPEAFIDIPNLVFENYELKTSIEPPVFGSLSTNLLGKSLDTDQGTLTFTSIGSEAAFGATAVPEPASLTLAGVVASGLVGYGWRLRKRAVA